MTEYNGPSILSPNTKCKAPVAPVGDYADQAPSPFSKYHSSEIKSSSTSIIDLNTNYPNGTEAKIAAVVVDHDVIHNPNTARVILDTLLAADPLSTIFEANQLSEHHNLNTVREAPDSFGGSDQFVTAFEANQREVTNESNTVREASSPLGGTDPFVTAFEANHLDVTNESNTVREASRPLGGTDPFITAFEANHLGVTNESNTLSEAPDLIDSLMSTLKYSHDQFGSSGKLKDIESFVNGDSSTALTAVNHHRDSFDSLVPDTGEGLELSNFISMDSNAFSAHLDDVEAKHLIDDKLLLTAAEMKIEKEKIQKPIKDKDAIDYAKFDNELKDNGSDQIISIDRIQKYLFWRTGPLGSLHGEDPPAFRVILILIFTLCC